MKAYGFFLKNLKKIVKVEGAQDFPQATILLEIANE